MTVPRRPKFLLCLQVRRSREEEEEIGVAVEMREKTKGTRVWIIHSRI
jgi:hypothetical protein